MEERLSLLSELIQLSLVDGHAEEKETAFIRVIAQSMGISDEQLLDLYQHPAPFDPQTSEFERIIQFHRLVLLMNIDQEIKPGELDYVRLAGIKMGLNPKATNEVLERMYHYPNHVIPPDILINIFQRHHN